MDFSKKLLKKLMAIQFKQVHTNWLQTIYSYMVDSKYRTKKRLDKFLKDQFKNPSPEVIKLAKELRGQDTDATMINILKWVKKNIKYTLDKDNFGKNEYWANGNLTYSLGKDDCDGMNGLIYYLARLAGIGKQCLYCAIGDVIGGGHFWVVYYSTSQEKLVVIDSTYYYTPKQIKIRQPFKLGEHYKTIWYLFNEDSIFKPR